MGAEQSAAIELSKCSTSTSIKLIGDIMRTEILRILIRRFSGHWDKHECKI